MKTKSIFLTKKRFSQFAIFRFVNTNFNNIQSLKQFVSSAGKIKEVVSMYVVHIKSLLTYSGLDSADFEIYQAMQCSLLKIFTSFSTQSEYFPVLLYSFEIGNSVHYLHQLRYLYWTDISNVNPASWCYHKILANILVEF